MILLGTVYLKNLRELVAIRRAPGDHPTIPSPNTHCSKHLKSISNFLCRLGVVGAVSTAY